VQAALPLSDIQTAPEEEQDQRQQKCIIISLSLYAYSTPDSAILPFPGKGAREKSIIEANLDVVANINELSQQHRVTALCM